MVFNIIKSQHRHIGKNITKTDYTIESDDQQAELEKVKHEKDLGVIIDHNLTFREHITSKVNIAYRNLGIIFRTFTYNDQEMFLDLSIVRPHLQHASTLKLLSKMFKDAQQKIKLISTCKILPYKERLYKLALPTSDTEGIC